MAGQKVDRDQIILPEINFTQAALEQLELIIENDFTLAGKYIRILISGKGCNGFTYSIGFTDKEENDFMVKVEGSNDLEVLIDPFAAFYLKITKVDYDVDFKNNTEGFVVTNEDQEKYHGKFWRQDKQLVPPQMKL